MNSRIKELTDKYDLKARKSSHLIPSDKEVEYKGTKVGGLPFLKNENSIPKKKGEFLKLAVQINFEDIGQIEGYPQDGILQLWIGDMNRSDFKVYEVIYYNRDELSQGLSEDEAREAYLNPDQTTGMYPMTGSFSLEAQELKDEYMTNYVFDILDEEYLDDEDLFAYFHKNLKGTKIGGYPFTYICKECETTCPLAEDYKPLILQIDSMEADTGNIIWGDLGIAHITVTKEELADKDFSNAYFYWDQMPELDFNTDF